MVKKTHKTAQKKKVTEKPKKKAMRKPEKIPLEMPKEKTVEKPVIYLKNVRHTSNLDNVIFISTFSFFFAMIILSFWFLLKFVF